MTEHGLAQASLAKEDGRVLKRSLKDSKRQAPTGPHANILALQRTVGNQAVTQLVKQSSGSVGVNHARLAINVPGDKYEQEADRIAEQVMCMPQSEAQRQVAPKEEELSEEPIRASSLSPIHSTYVLPEASTQIQTLRGGGQPLSEEIRAFFEPRFGYDFGHVRVHTGAGAAELARALNARAFTVGHDIVFGAGEYVPSIREGQLLLAHELTHVVQQGRRETVHRKTAQLESFQEQKEVVFDKGTTFSQAEIADFGENINKINDYCNTQLLNWTASTQTALITFSHWFANRKTSPDKNLLDAMGATIGSFLKISLACLPVAGELAKLTTDLATRFLSGSNDSDSFVSELIQTHVNIDNFRRTTLFNRVAELLAEGNPQLFSDLIDEVTEKKAWRKRLDALFGWDTNHTVELLSELIHAYREWEIRNDPIAQGKYLSDPSQHEYWMRRGSQMMAEESLNMGIGRE